MLKDMYVVDNVFPHPDEVVKWANTLEFHDNDTHNLNKKTRFYWKGRRTYGLQEDSTENREKTNLLIHDVFKGCLSESFNNFSYKFDWEGFFYFHRLDKDCNFTNSWLHTDTNCIYAGVVYLNKDAPKNGGTMIYKENDKVEYVENVYNRMVLYKSKFKHSAMCGFGEKENSRLTFTMSFKKIELSIKSD